jgi:tRNA G18 (ribose-2'-O)-methylase SpoU
MPDPIEIDSLDGPRVAPYRNLKDRELAKDGGRFITERELVVKRLLASDYPTESVLLARRQAPEVAPLVPPGVPVYVADARLVHRIVGYRFHSGVLAVGRRKAGLRLEAVVPPAPAPVLLVVCPDLISTDNLGSLIRLAAGFGADAVVLGDRCCDPFFRRAVRVSMGNVFRVPLVRAADILADLARLRKEFQVQLAATVLDPSAESLDRAARPPRFALLFGSEEQGLASEHVAACDWRVTLPMRRGTESLNVATAAAIFLYHFRRDAPLASE